MEEDDDDDDDGQFVFVASDIQHATHKYHNILSAAVCPAVLFCYTLSKKNATILRTRKIKFIDIEFVF